MLSSPARRAVCGACLAPLPPQAPLSAEGRAVVAEALAALGEPQANGHG